MQIVKPVTNLGRSGLQDWLLQRGSAIVLTFYFLFLCLYCFFSSEISYDSWKNLFSLGIMQVSSIIVLFSLLIHAWIGIWTVLTDYIKNLVLRLFLESLFGLGLLFSLLWGIRILWK